MMFWTSLISWLVLLPFELHGVSFCLNFYNLNFCHFFYSERTIVFNLYWSIFLIKPIFLCRTDHRFCLYGSVVELGRQCHRITLWTNHLLPSGLTTKFASGNSQKQGWLQWDRQECVNHTIFSSINTIHRTSRTC